MTAILLLAILTVHPAVSHACRPARRGRRTRGGRRPVFGAGWEAGDV